MTEEYIPACESCMDRGCDKCMKDYKPQLKTLADLKRTIKPGVVLDLVHLQTNWSPGPRKVVSTNTVGFGLETTRPDGKIVTSYCDWPNAKHLRIVSDSQFEIHGDWYFLKVGEVYSPILRYTIIP